MAKRGRKRGTCDCSQWELDEMAALYGAGWRIASLASLYSVTERTIRRRLIGMGVELRGRSEPILAPK